MSSEPKTIENYNFISFNVGGQKFLTTRETLQTQENHYLLQISMKHSDGSDIFIDRNPKFFPYILDFLRKKKLNLKSKSCWLEDLYDEADYYSLTSLKAIIIQRMENLALSYKKASKKVNSKARSFSQTTSRSDVSLCELDLKFLEKQDMLNLSNNSKPFQNQSIKRCAPQSCPRHFKLKIDDIRGDLSRFPYSSEHQLDIPTVVEQILDENLNDSLQVKYSLMNDHQTPPQSPHLPADYNLGPQILGSDSENF